MIPLDQYISSFGDSPLASHIGVDPWWLTQHSERVVRELLASLQAGESTVRCSAPEFVSIARQ
jgi:hypothetical protein